MTGGTVFIRGTFMSCVVRSYLSCRMKQMASWLRLLPHIRHLRVGDSTERTATGVSYASLVTASRRHTHSPTSQHRNRQQPSARHSSTGGGWGGDDRNRFPVKLMDFPEITMPDFVKSFRNKFFAFLIKGYYDSTFTVDGFVEGATQAASYVSSCISDGNFADLKGLVVDEAIQEIQNNYADLTYQQRRWLRVKPTEIIGRFVYEIGMMFDDDTDQRFVEITVVLHGYHDLENTPDSLSDLYSRMGENPDKFYVCNYRFIREFTKGVEDSWTINKLNHFLPFVPPEDEDSTRM